MRPLALIVQRCATLWRVHADQGEAPIRWRDNRPRRRATASSPRKTPVAIVVNGATVAVLLATPADLADFATGFALTEGLVATAAEAGAIEVVTPRRRHRGAAEHRRLRRARIARGRTITGPSGCGLCGVESLAAAVVPPRVVTAAGPRPTPAEIVAAVAALGEAQPLGRSTRAVHGAALWRRGKRR